MSAKDLIVQHASAPGGRLILLFHGVGSRPEDLVPLRPPARRGRPGRLGGQRVLARAQRPRQRLAVVLGARRDRGQPPGAHRHGHAVLRALRARLAGKGRVDAAGTTLDRASRRGSIMALESTQLPETLAAQVISLAGRFAAPPRVARAGHAGASAARRAGSGDRSALQPARRRDPAWAWRDGQRRALPGPGAWHRCARRRGAGQGLRRLRRAVSAGGRRSATQGLPPSGARLVLRPTACSAPGGGNPVDSTGACPRHPTRRCAAISPPPVRRTAACRSCAA